MDEFRKMYLTNSIEFPDFNAKLEATNKLIKDIKRNAFDYRNFDNLKNAFTSLWTAKKRKQPLFSLELNLNTHYTWQMAKS